MEYSRESLDRIEKIQALKEAGVVCYANNFRGKQDIETIKNEELRIKNGITLKDADALMEIGAVGEIKTAGRLMSSRGMGKLLFGKIRDNTADIQVCFMKDTVLFNTGNPSIPSRVAIDRDSTENANIVNPPNPLYQGETVESLEISGETKSAFKIVEKYCQVGDYIGVTGDLFITKHGELTIFVKEFQILSKAVRPLPEKFHGVTDQETIYRQRYLDLIMNEESYERFLFRSNFIRYLREFYLMNGFVEITTPTLGNAASGAAAKPFITHHNDYDEEMYLRIAPEIGLKKATVGRFEKVFEFATNFRNEGSDPSHIQEFNVVEHYSAWWNFEDNIKFTEEMFDYLFDKLELDRKIEVKDKNGVIKTADFTTPFERIDYIEGVKKACSIDVSAYKNGEEARLLADIKSKGIDFEGMDNMIIPTLIDYLYKKVLRPSIVGPAFVYNYPKTLQPLARQSDNNPDIVEQFQLVVNGWEINKAYSELVDPKIQIENFEEQAHALIAGDEEATAGDDDFILAMEYGMPPQSGFGMGFDRILTILTKQDNLRDIVLFPLMKSEGTKEVGTGKSKKTMIAVAILNKEARLESWQELNTIAHLNAAFGARKGKSLFLQDKIMTHDGQEINFNIQHAIIIKESNTNNEILELLTKAKEKDLHIAEFTREMLLTTDDTKVVEMTSRKNHSDVEYLGVLVFGEKKEVEEMTKGFSFYK